MSATFQNAPATLPASFQVAGASLLSSGWIRVTGSDRTRWLNGMVTNSVQALTPGQGAYTFLLNAQGRIQGDAVLWDAEKLYFLETSPEQTAPMMALLDHYIIMDDVELADMSSSFHGVQLAGPQAAEILAQLGFAVPAGPYGWAIAPWMGHSLCLQTMHSPLAQRFELWSDSEQTMHDLLGALLAAGAAQVTADDFEQLRILGGTPKYGTDIRDRDLPQETNQMQALHFNKGCYLGQEIVERIRSRGSVHRTFHTFTLAGEKPVPGTALEADGKSVGELTSITEFNSTLHALGYIRREVLDRGLPITYAGGTATATASSNL